MDGPIDPPMIVNNTLLNHPLIFQLASHFRLIKSVSTPPDTLQFPSYQCSCLLLDTSINISHTLLDTCLAFLSSNTNPFILLTPSSPGKSSPHSVTTLSHQLTTQLVPLSMKTPMVVATWTIELAMTTLLKLVTEQVEQQMCQAGQADMVVALTESGLCKDRVDTLLLLSQVERFNCLAEGERDIPREVMNWLKEDKELI